MDPINKANNIKINAKADKKAPEKEKEKSEVMTDEAVAMGLGAVALAAYGVYLVKNGKVKNLQKEIKNVAETVTEDGSKDGDKSVVKNEVKGTVSEIKAEQNSSLEHIIEKSENSEAKEIENFNKADRNEEEIINNNVNYSEQETKIEEDTKNKNFELKSEEGEKSTTAELKPAIEDEFRELSDTEFEELKTQINEKLDAIPEIKKTVNGIKLDKNNIRLLDKIISDKKLCTNENVIKNIQCIFWDIKTPEVAKVKAELLDTLEHENMLDKCGMDIFLGIRTSNEVEFAKEIFSNKELQNNENVVKNIGDILECANDPEKKTVCKKILADKNLSKSKNVMAHIEDFSRLSSVPRTKELAEKILSNKELYDNENLYKKKKGFSFSPFGILGVVTDTPEIAKVKTAFLDTIEKHNLFDNENVMNNAFEILYTINTPEQLQMTEKILSNKKLCNNKNFMDSVGMFYVNPHIPEESSARADFIDNLEKEGLLDKQNVLDKFSNILADVDDEETAKIKIDFIDTLKKKGLLSDENVSNKLGVLLHCVCTPELSELTEKALSNQEIRNNKNVMNNIETILHHSNVQKNPDEAIKLLKECNEETNIHDILTIIPIISKNVESLQFREITDILDALNNLPKDMLNVLKKHYNIDEIIRKLQTRLGEKRGTISIPIEQQKLFFKNIVANNDPSAEKCIKTFDFAKYGRAGLPLKYSRTEFTNNVKEALKNLNQEDQQKLLDHFGLIRGERGFDGLPTNKVFKSETASDEVKEVATKIQAEIEKFTTKNEVITGNPEADKVLTGLVQGLPEFTSVVGKGQHGTHAYSVDIHTLKVLQSAMNDPLYTKLSDKDKTVLKISAILHDLGKKGGVIDTGHASTSAEYVYSILDKFSLPRDMKDRIIDIVDNHHWFEDYNTGKIMAEDVAVRCRRPEDFTIYEILAKSDFENVNRTFHLNKSGVESQKEFDEFFKKKMEPINETLNKIYTKSNLVYDTKFIRNGKFFPRETVKINGVEHELKVLDLNKISGNEDLEKYGFTRGVTKDSARFIVHMAEPGGMETVKILTQNPLYQSAWSTSLIKTSNNRTYAGRKYGFIFDVDQANISEAYYRNIQSGYEKGLGEFKNIIFNHNGEARTYVRNNLVNELKEKGIDLTDNEYSELVRQILSKKFTTQIENVKVGDKTIPGYILVDCLKSSEDKLFEGGNIHSEIVDINPRISGLVAKADKIEDCPDAFLEFAQKNDLPIVLMKDVH